MYIKEKYNQLKTWGSIVRKPYTNFDAVVTTLQLWITIIVLIDLWSRTK